MSGLQSVFRPLAEFFPPSRAHSPSFGAAGQVNPACAIGPGVFDCERIEACECRDTLDAALDELRIAIPDALRCHLNDEVLLYA